jgi:hypothetical protein
MLVPFLGCVDLDLRGLNFRRVLCLGEGGPRFASRGFGEKHAETAAVKRRRKSNCGNRERRTHHLDRSYHFVVAVWRAKAAESAA